jgi:indole-3-glycerol phosphate synthase
MSIFASRNELPSVKIHKSVAQGKMMRSSGVVSAGGVLDQIIEAKARRVEQSKRKKPLTELVQQALHFKASSLESHSLTRSLSRKGEVNIIAEIKRRSPSKGIIRENFDPAIIAQGYAEAAAAAISVLTEEDFFDGSLDHLLTVRRHIPHLPLLRKDFIFDKYQIYESAAVGADAVLLIASILSDELLAELLGTAGQVGLEALVEVHSPEEMKRAAGAGARLIGVNNRDLTTFKVELETSLRLAALAPTDAILVSESGINTAEEIKRLISAGYHAFLIGERLMREPDPGAALAKLIYQARE